MHDASLPLPSDPMKVDFLWQQCDIEIEKGCFSAAFGPDLLPGIYSMPIHAVPKPNSDDLRMVTDQSAGNFSLNSMIPREDIRGYPLDNMKRLGDILLQIQWTEGNGPLTLFKSDVAEAYRLLSVHPYWQIKQINTLGLSRHMDWRLAFGGRASQCFWIAFMASVTWIAVHVRLIALLSVYSDNAFAPE